MTNGDWLDNLNTSFKLNIPHISSYALTVEKKTPLYNKIQSNRVPPISEYQIKNQFAQHLFPILHQKKAYKKDSQNMKTG